MEFDEAVESLDLLDGPEVPRRARLAAGRVPGEPAVELGLLGQQVRVGTDHRQRRPELMGDQGDQLVARLVQGLELGDLGLGVALEAALLEDPRQQVRDR